ncbi:hypothetical protein [Couchioplanes caeruleus]|uniref:Uncharacterized protein n=2 Tax=Couchioplanes caeruleus TaxID=56438 RepID=A0A1K0FLG4_9ACTN|nr:hypothetical protein [Couchioplanes caeruleus]OJF13687.1 hypothetical protein BG844_13890 [Couchioplanes caeruleus subsp. caeruleus]ROP28945.1 hypothetical protein EDD30_1724 [Couchioplanes caeruleus]
MNLLGDDAFQVAHEAAHALRRSGPAGLEAQRDVIAADRAAAQAAGMGAHDQRSAAASHAEEALALAEVRSDERVGAAR